MNVREKIDSKIGRLFAQSNQSSFEKITQALQAKDFKTAHRLAHSLKSNAGYIDEQPLKEASLALELALKPAIADFAMSASERALTAPEISAPEISVPLKIIKSELERILAELSPLLSESVVLGNAAAQTDNKQVLESFDRLHPLLAARSAASLIFLVELRGLSAIPGMDELIQQIESYDFGRAVETLVRIRREFLT